MRIDYHPLAAGGYAKTVHSAHKPSLPNKPAPPSMSQHAPRTMLSPCLSADFITLFVYQAFVLIEQHVTYCSLRLSIASQ